MFYVGESLLHSIIMSITCNFLFFDTKVDLNLAEAGFSTPTPVQMFIIPMVLMRRDLLTCAPTGSGKSMLLTLTCDCSYVCMLPTCVALSFLLPLITLLVRRTKPSERTSPRVLILAPTRELAMQIEQQSKQLMKGELDSH